MSNAEPSRTVSIALESVLEAVKPAQGVELCAAFERMKSKLLDRTPRRLALGRYRLVRELGRGALGVVFLAHDGELQRDVAIKVLQRGPYARIDGCPPDAALLDEARILAATNHPNIVTALDCGVGAITDRAPPEVYLVMEYVPGSSLAEWLVDPRPVQEIRRVFLAAARGLAAAHRVGIIHHDFKAENVLLGADGSVKVTDFGLAHRSDSASIDAAEAAAMRTGAQPYGRGSASARDDQFALCMSLHAALVGSFPKLCADGTMRTDLAGRQLPRSLRCAMLRGLQCDSSRRHASLEPLIAALREAPPMRRAAWIVPGIVVGISVPVALAAAAALPEETQCRTSVEAWNADVRRDVQRAFESSRKPYAAEVWRTVDSHVGVYAAALADRRTQLCEARTADNDGAQLRCLEARERQLSVAVDSWTRPGAVEHAVASASALADLDACAAASDPALQEVEHPQARALARRAKAMMNLDEFRLAATLAVDARELADEAGDTVGGAQARLQHGEALLAAGELDEARSELQSAFFMAGVARADGVALDAALVLTYVIGFSNADEAGAARWREFSEQRLAQSDDRRSRARLANTLGAIAQRHSRFEEAAEHFRVVLADEHNDAAEYSAQSPIRLVNGYNGLGLSLANLGQLEDARGYLHSAIDVCDAALGQSHPRCATPRVNLANTEQIAGRSEEALRYAQQALETRERELGPDHLRIAEALTTIGLARMHRGELDEAGTAHARALEIVEARLGADHALTVTSRYNLGLVHQMEGRSELALATFTMALQAMEGRFGPEDRRIAAVAGSIGAVQAELGHTAQGARSLERALAMHQSRPTPPIRLASTQFNLARLLGDSTETHRRALALAEAARANLVRGLARPEQLELVDAWIAEHAVAGE